MPTLGKTSISDGHNLYLSGHGRCTRDYVLSNRLLWFTAENPLDVSTNARGHRRRL